MSKYDDIRKKRREQGAAARDRVLSGMYSQPETPSPSPTSKYDSIRNRSSDTVEADTQSAYNKGKQITGNMLQQSIDSVNAGQQALSNAQNITGNMFNSALKNANITSPPVQDIRGYEDPKSKGLGYALIRGAGDILDGITFGLSEPLTDKFNNYAEEVTRPALINEGKLQASEPFLKMGGSLASGLGVYRAAGSLLSPVTRAIPGVADKLVKGPASLLPSTAGALTRVAAQQGGKFGAKALTGLAGSALYQAPVEAVEELYGKNDQTFGERMGDIGQMALLGAVLDPVASEYLSGLGTVFQRLLKRNGVPDEQAKEILALPMSRSQQAQWAKQQAQSAASDPIVTPYTFKLPAPSVSAPTTARIAQQVNPYQRQFETLMERAQQMQAQGRFTPGREDLELEQLWASMAGREAPGLDELITLAYKTTPNKVTPNLVQRARTYQNSRQVAGAPMPVRSMSDRLPPQGPLNAAAAPQSVPARAPMARQTDVLPAQQQTGPRVDVTPQPVPLRASVRNDILPNQPPLQRVNAADNKPVQSELIQNPPQNTPNRIDVKPDTPHVPAEPIKQDLITSLFGDTQMGISAFGNVGRVRNPFNTEGQIVNSATKGPGLKESVNKTARETYQTFVDSNDPIKMFSKEAYERSMDARRANNTANTIIHDAFVTPEGEVVGESLETIFKKIPRGRMDQFLDYLILRHANTRMARGEKVYADSLAITPQKIADRMKFHESRLPGIDKVSADWDNFIHNLRKYYGVDENLIAQELADSLRLNNPFYAPMKRQFSWMERFSNKNYGGGSQFSGQKAPIQQVSPTGSTRKIVDPRRSIMEQVGAWVNAGYRNRTMISIVDAIKRDPDGMKGIAEIVQPKKGTRKINDVLRSEGDEAFLDELNQDFAQLFKKQSVGEDNIVRAMVKGEPIYIKVHHPEAVKALVGMGADQANMVMRFAQWVSNAIKRSATGLLSPTFAVKSLTADATQSIIQSNKPLAQFGNLFHATLSSLADTLPKGTPGFDGLRALAQEYRRAGGQYSAALRGDKAVSKSVSRLQRNPIVSPRMAWEGVKLPFRAAEGFANLSENIPRMAAYKTELKSLGGQRTNENVMKAMRASQESTVNFSRKGSASQSIEAFIPYSNAAIQGLRRTMVQWKNNPIKTAALVGGAVMLPKTIEYMRFHDDPDYQKLTAREKYRNLIVSKNDDGTFNKVFMPMEYNPIGALLVDTLMAMRDSQPEMFKGVADALMTNYLPPVVGDLAKSAYRKDDIGGLLGSALNSTIAGVPAQLFGNKDYAGRPIESMALEDRSPGQRYDERTSSIAKWIGEQVNWSPKKIDYFMRSYGGDPARMILPLTSESGGGNPTRSLLKNWIVDPVYSNTLTDDFFKMRTKVTQAYRDFEETGKPLPEWFSEDLRKEVTSTAKGWPMKELQWLQEDKRAISKDNSLTAKQKSDKQRELQAKINGIYMDLNTFMIEKGVK